MNVKKYITRPTKVEAIQLQGNRNSILECTKFIEEKSQGTIKVLSDVYNTLQNKELVVSIYDKITTIPFCMFIVVEDLTDISFCRPYDFAEKYEEIEKSDVAPAPAFSFEADDKINKPNHYRMNIKGAEIEVMDIIEAILTPEEFRGYKKGNVLKYILREKLKNGLEDLKKCENYLKRLIQGEENVK